MEGSLFLQKINKPFGFLSILLKGLPMAFLAGCKLKEINHEQCTTKLKYKYLVTNPFSSMYFACMAMAAELAPGLLCIMYVYKRKPEVSMLIVSHRSFFYKKAIGEIVFICKDGNAISETINKTIAENKPQIFESKTEAFNQEGILVGEFYFTWSFKAKT